MTPRSKLALALRVRDPRGRYEFAGKMLQEHGPVILASGGFGADFSADSLLAKSRERQQG